MEKRKSNQVSPNYQFANPALWIGRKVPIEDGVQYWYQQVQGITDASHTIILPDHSSKIGLIGYACDEGVRRNLGRVGAKEGPDAIRKQLAKLAWHHPELAVVDFGDTVCNDEIMEACQEQLSNLVKQLLDDSFFPIVLGGGHDIAYGHFMGLQKSLPNNQGIGIINFDAHFDLRPVVEQGNSGTPFNQILSNSAFDQVHYMVVGIQPPANTKRLFNIAESKGVQFVRASDCHLAKAKKIKKQLKDFIASCDSIYISIDLDGFSSVYAPGVSATSPMGFEPWFVTEMLSFLFASEKVVSLDLAEMNPTYDQDNATAKLAARLIDYCCGLIG